MVWGVDTIFNPFSSPSQVRKYNTMIFIKKLITILCFSMILALGTSEFIFGSQQSVKMISSKPASVQNADIRISDCLGREIVLNKPAETFIGLFPSACELLKILNKENGIIAHDSYTTDAIFFPGINKLPTINSQGSGNALDYEKIMTLNPDLLIIMKNPAFDPADAIAKLHPTIPVAVLETDNVYTIGENIKKLGKLVGRETQAKRFAVFNDGIRDKILERVKKVDESLKPTFFFRIAGWTREQLCTMTDRSMMVKTQMVDAGGRNVSANLAGVFIQEFDHEWLLTRNYDNLIWMVWEKLYPGYLGYDVKDSTHAARLAAEISNMDVFAGSRAVKNSKVFLFDARLSTSPRGIILMAYMAKWFHPERFEDMDPRALHQQYLDDFLHVDIDLKKQGVLYYPQL